MNDQELRRAKRTGLVLFLYCAVVACGGGSADTTVDSSALSSAPLGNESPVQTAMPAIVTTNTAIAASCQSSGTSDFKAEVLQRVNALRAAGAMCGTVSYLPTPALNWSNLLEQAANGHSSDMAQNNYFSHDSLDGRTFTQRLTAAGYNYSAAGENIAAGDVTVEQVVNHWLNSPGHCVNMMNPAYREVGVACANNSSATYSNYWTMDLGQ